MTISPANIFDMELARHASIEIGKLTDERGLAAFFRNCKRHPSFTPAMRPSDVLRRAFDWGTTPEGEAFWETIHNKLIAKNQ